MSDKVKVNIDVTETVNYSAQVEMTQAEFDRLDKALCAGGVECRKATIEIGQYLDPRTDWQDSDTDSVDTFEIDTSDVIDA